MTTHSSMRTVPDVSLRMGGCPAGISVDPCGTPRSASIVAVGGSLDPGLHSFHQHIGGFNGCDYTARVYDRVVGVGTPHVRDMILAPNLPAAGNPQTPSNP